MRIGYGRVSTRDQNPDGQRDALDTAGCDEVFVDKASGTLASHPKLDEALRISRKGDQLVVTKLPTSAAHGGRSAAPTHATTTADARRRKQLIPCRVRGAAR